LSELARQASRVLADLNRDGFILRLSLAPHHSTAEVAQALGRVINLETMLPYSGISAVRSLRPKSASDSGKNRYSGHYGLGIFPLHTDLAHWASPSVGADYRRVHSVANAVEDSTTIAALSTEQVQQGQTALYDVQATRRGYPTFQNLSLFAQDSWKVKPRLTLDYGVRWEFNPPPGAVDGFYPLALTSSNLATTQFAPGGTLQYRTRYLNFAPRFGFAYQINSSPVHALVVKGAYGLFYDTGQNLGAIGYGGYPFTALNFVFPSTPISLPIPSAEIAPPSLVATPPPYPQVSLNDPNLRLPYTEQWNLSLSANPSMADQITISYVGNAGKKLLYVENYSNLSGINPLFQTVQFANNGSWSSYNALQIQNQGRIASGLVVIASYTWAHALDNASTDNANFGPVPGNSDSDVRHSVNVAFVYKIPGATHSRFLSALSNGWSFDGRFQAQTGTPVYIIQGFYLQPPNLQNEVVYPDLNSGVPVVLRNGPGDPFGWALNPAAFSRVMLNPDGSPVHQGNLPRNYVHGPAFWSLNGAAQRIFPLTDRVRLLFRVEAFNILNHANPTDPDGCMCDGPFFGLVGVSRGAVATQGVNNPLYATGSARSLQLVLKLQF
jgi:hypothetical protein